MRILMLLLVLGLAACSATKKTSDSSLTTAMVMTSAQCGMCEDRIEEAFNGVNGVSMADLDVDSKKLKVKYNSAVISLDAIRQIVSKVGYDADEVPADAQAYQKLPACCKKGGGH
jgi:copper chaperone CopZ